jgi:hypothetical protein
VPKRSKKTGEDETKSPEEERKREKARQRRHEALLGEAYLPEKEPSNDDSSSC